MHNPPRATPDQGVVARQSAKKKSAFQSHLQPPPTRRVVVRTPSPDLCHRGWSEYRLAAVCGCGGQKIYPTVSSPPPLQPAGLEQHRRARPSTAASPPPSAPGASPAGCAVRRGQPPGQLTFQRATFGVSIWDRRDNSPQFALASRSGGGGQQFPPGLTEIRDLFKTLKLAILSIEPRFTCNASGQTRGDKIGCLSFQPDAGKHHQ